MIALDGSVQKTTDGGFVVAFDRPIDRPVACPDRLRVCGNI